MRRAPITFFIRAFRFETADRTTPRYNQRSVKNGAGYSPTPFHTPLARLRQALGTPSSTLLTQRSRPRRSSKSNRPTARSVGSNLTNSRRPAEVALIAEENHP